MKQVEMFGITGHNSPSLPSAQTPVVKSSNTHLNENSEF